jgi:hypothetical protein
VDSSGVRFTVACADSVSGAIPDTLRLSCQFIQPGSYSVILDGGTVLRDTIDFVIDRRLGLLRFTRAFRASMDTAHTHRVHVAYLALPFNFQPVYRKRELVARRDTARGDTIRVATPSTPMNMESIFGTELQKSGYIGRGFTVGTNRDMTLNSGFRLQLNGKLAQDIDIMAALTDENTPIQPEGNTRTIQELDKVFIKLSSAHMAATLGDFALAYGGSEFGRYNRKLSGVLGEVKTDQGNVTVSYASMKGTFHSVQFNGQDGVQGPYRLTGKNGEQRILVLAGTERVYVDGVEMARGEGNDYVIEYAAGEVYFRPRRLITSYARITVDFEYAEQQYVRSLLTADANTALFSSVLKVGARFMREADNQDSPIEQQLSDADREVLLLAGDDQQKAATSGIAFAGYDTARHTGAALYARIDTTIAGQPYTVYRYEPGADSATWNAVFSYVGSGKGDYTRRTIGSFQFVGIGLGDYAPVRLLPMPRLHQTAIVFAEAHPWKSLRLGGEGAFSAFVQNRFSDLDTQNDNGDAYKFTLDWKQAATPIGGVELGGSLRTVSADFSAIDRINDIEFNRKWDVSSTAVARETIREGHAAFTPWRPLRLSAGFGGIARGGFASQRVEGGLELQADTSRRYLPAFSYAFEAISSDESVSSLRGAWFRQRGEVRFAFAAVQPRLRFESEHRRSSAGERDTLTGNSYGFVDIRPGVAFPEFWNMTLAVEAGLRDEDALLDGAVRKQSRDMLGQVSWSLRSWNALSANAAFTLRDRSYTETFRLRGNKDIETILTKMQAQYAPLQRAIATDVLYEVSTERSSKLERVFLKVPFGQGNYMYKGDLNNNGIADENEFEPTRFDGDYVLTSMPTDQLFPTIDLRGSIRVQVKPERALRGGGGFVPDLLRSVSTETYARVEEKSSNEHTSDIYLLRFSTFQNDSTTIRGYQNFRQDLFLFEQSQEFSLRFRFDQNRGMTQYALANERSYRKERSLRMRMQLVREIGLQSDLAFITDNVSSTQSSNRARAIASTVSTTDFSYRPINNTEFGFVLTMKSATDSYNGTPLEASVTSMVLRSSLSFDGPGRVRIEVERNEVTLSDATAIFPYELTDGRPDGLSWVWRANVDYRLTSFLQATATYLGRTEGNGPVVHTARAEVKAYF